MRTGLWSFYPRLIGVENFQMAAPGWSFSFIKYETGDFVGDFENPMIKTKPDGDCDFFVADKRTDFKNSVKCLLLPENEHSKGSPNSGWMVRISNRIEHHSGGPWMKEWVTFVRLGSHFIMHEIRMEFSWLWITGEVSSIIFHNSKLSQSQL